MADIRIEKLRKEYGDFVATNDVSLHIRDGEFFTLLGPSGCGKSTLLSMIAGLVQPDGGKLTVGERVFSDSGKRAFVLPEHRDCGLVFQSYALWPHMTVEQNLGYGLKVKRVPKDERTVRIRDALALVELSELGSRYPHELSGGQQQRAALARTIVARPTVLLLDEPLSNLDAKLRMQARIWLKRIHRETGLTTVYVTHDQEEALSLSTRIAVMDAGNVEQVADPESLYNHPSSRKVATFIGSTRFLEGSVVEVYGGRVVVAVEGYGHAGHTLEVDQGSGSPWAVGDPVALALRPEQLRISKRSERAADAPSLPCEVEAVSYLGGRYQYSVRVGTALLEADSPVLHDGDDFAVTITGGTVPVFRSEQVTA